MVTYQSPEDLREAVNMFQRSRVILTAYELEIFTATGINGKTSAEIAALINADARATDRLLNALVVCGLMEKKNGLFRNTGFSEKFLNKNSPDFLAGFGHSVNMWNTWSQLTDVIRCGHTLRDGTEKTPQWNESFIAAMHERASKQADEVIAKIDLSGVNKILDVGGGSGAYSIAFAKAKKHIHCVVLDRPEILLLTEKYIRAANMQETVATLPGDYHTTPLGTGYDMVFLSAIIHINSPDENKLLIKRCTDALNHNGQLVIQDHIMNDDRTSPVPGVFFALNMLVATRHGDTYTEKEITGWMKEAGLTNFRRAETRNNALLIGIKP